VARVSPHRDGGEIEAHQGMAREAERRVVEEVGDALGGIDGAAGRAGLGEHRQAEIVPVAPGAVDGIVADLGIPEQGIDRGRPARRLVGEAQRAAHQPRQGGVDREVGEDRGAKRQERAGGGGGKGRGRGERHAALPSAISSSTWQTSSRRRPSGSPAARMAKRRGPLASRIAGVIAAP
jgi:hypothetical protein